MKQSVEWMERHQIALYIAGLAFGSILGLMWPAVAHPAEIAIHPVLALLLYATFLGIPFGRIGQAFRDWRFLSTILLVNFLVVPLVVWVLSRIIAHDSVLLVGVLFVLLTPCVDYVIVFAGIAGGNEEKLLVAAPVLMLAQMLLLPVYLWGFVGAEFVGAVQFGPFVDAFLWIIALPLVAAALTQLAATRSHAGKRVERAVLGSMVPVMTLTLAIVVASQVLGVRAELESLLLVIPVFVLFAAVMVPIGILASRAAGLDTPSGRAIVFSGATRNSLVVLPLVLALPAAYSLAPLVVVTQTLIELVAMVIFVKLIPRLIPAT